MTLELIIKDKVNGRKWRTPNHSDDSHKDDIHEVKKEILFDFGNKFGYNPDIEIHDGKIVLRETNMESGKSRRTQKTGLDANWYFDTVQFLTQYCMNHPRIYEFRFIELKGLKKARFYIKVT